MTETRHDEHTGHIVLATPYRLQELGAREDEECDRSIYAESVVGKPKEKEEEEEDEEEK